MWKDLDSVKRSIEVVLPTLNVVPMIVRLGNAGVLRNNVHELDSLVPLDPIVVLVIALFVNVVDLKRTVPMPRRIARGTRNAAQRIAILRNAAVGHH